MHWFDERFRRNSPTETTSEKSQVQIYFLSMNVVGPGAGPEKSFTFIWPRFSVHLAISARGWLSSSSDSSDSNSLSFLSDTLMKDCDYRNIILAFYFG